MNRIVGAVSDFGSEGGEVASEASLKLCLPPWQLLRTFKGRGPPETASA